MARKSDLQPLTSADLSIGTKPHRRLYPKVMTAVDRLLTSREIAEMAGCHIDTARRFILRERLGRKIGGRYKARLSVVLANYPDLAGTVMFL